MKLDQLSDLETQIKYYSHWSIAAIHVLLTIPEFRTRAAIAAKLNLSTTDINAGLDFLKDQLADLNTRKKLQSHVDQIWGDGYTLEIKVGKEAPAGKSAQELARQKETEKQEELAKKIAAHPMVQAATQSFKGQIKSIKDVKQK